MASSINLTEDWADGTYTFRLGVAQLEEHDDKLKMGPVAVLGALMDGTFRHGHIRETLRLGLIGGGTSPVEAEKLCRRYVDDRPIVENLVFATAILGQAIHGKVDDRGKAEAAKPSTDPEGSTSPPSDETPAPSASDAPI